ncbi:hypothetical protein [Microbulbifer yueqingensis]|nr:hypothetical protein [Microbulbifer yueqingensis]
MAVFLSSQAAIPALAQSSDELDVTVVEADESAADVVNEIELPESASDTARMAVEEGGLAVADAARAGELGRDEELEEELEKAANGVANAEEAALRAEQALLEATANANEAAAEAIKNALSSGASAEEILENIPADVMENLPEDIQEQLNEALDNIPEVETPEVETPAGG